MIRIDYKNEFNVFKNISYTIFFIILACCGSLFLTSCNLFSPRNAEVPEADNNWNTFYTTPYITIENLNLAYTSRQNISNYQGILDSNFKFYFDEYDIVNFQAPNSINKNTELTFLQKIFNFIPVNEEIEFILIENNTDDVILTNEAWIYRNYEIKIPHTLDGLDNICSGEFEFYLIRDNNGFWKIKNWKDTHISEQNSTLGRIKNEII